MNTLTGEQAQRLLRLSEELSKLAMELTQPHAKMELPAFPAEAARKVAQRICLNCTAQIEPSKRYVRGLCQNCATEIKRRIRLKEATEVLLISKGLLAPRRPGGRKQKPRRSRASEILSCDITPLPVEDAASDERLNAIKKRIGDIEDNTELRTNKENDLHGQ